MTNDLEKHFFDTFGIEPIQLNKCSYVNLRNLGLEYGTDICLHLEDGTITCDNCENNKDGDLLYPQITDRILLGIIAKIMWSYSCTQNDFDAYEVHTVDNLKEAVLKHAIELSKNDAYVYWGVRTLFEEG